MNTTFQDHNGDKSSKRIIGTFLIGFVLAVITIYMARKIDVPDNTTELLQTIFGGGILLITATVAEKFAKKNN